MESGSMDSHGDSSLNTSDASLHPSESDTSLPPSETSLHPSDESDTNGNGSVIKEPAIDDQTLVEEIGRQYKIAESASNHVSAALKVHDDWRFEKLLMDLTLPEWTFDEITEIMLQMKYNPYDSDEYRRFRTELCAKVKKRDVLKKALRSPEIDHSHEVIQLLDNLPHLENQQFSWWLLVGSISVVIIVIAAIVAMIHTYLF